MPGKPEGEYRCHVVASSEKREVIPDPKYKNQIAAKFMNHVKAISGKKSVAEKIVYGALDRIQQRTGGDPIEVFLMQRRKPSPRRLR